MRKLLEKADHVLIGGHRGCSCQYPENSIKAMEEGIKRGADYLEIDIQLTKDKVPAVIHDVRMEKQTRLTGYVHDFTYEQLKESIPGLCTMEEAMEWGRIHQVYFGLELKTVPWDMQKDNLELTERMADILERKQMKENVFVFGPDFQVLKHLKQKDPDIQLGLIVPFVPEDPVGLMKQMDALIYLSYIYNMTPQIVRDLQDAGYYVDGAILKEKKWVEAAVRAGVDMFELDYPEKFDRKLDFGFCR